MNLFTNKRRRWYGAILASLILALTFAIPPLAAQADPPILNCMPQLTTCGYPSALTTGADPNTSFTPFTGVYDTTANNEVIEDLDITGCIVVHHTGVVIQNVKIHGDCFNGIDFDSGSFSVTDSSIACDDGENTGIDAENATITRVFVERCENAITVTHDVTIQDSFLMAFEAAPGISHGDLIQAFAGDTVTIDHNTLAGYRPLTSVIIADLNNMDDYVITDNFLMGGAYELYCALSTNSWTVTGNRFYPLPEDANPGAGIESLDRRGPAFGLTVNCDGDVDITWSGNFSDFDGATVNSDGTLT